jgi:arsenate reductase
MTTDTRVLFVCVHNSARSQMAQALLRHIGGAHFTVESAGFEPQAINPLAIEAMRDIGLDLIGAKSQSVFDLFRAGRRYDYVISVCDEAAGERCPIFPGITQRVTWSFPDPAAFEGSRDERLAKMVQLREHIASRIETWVHDRRAGHAP